MSKLTAMHQSVIDRMADLTAAMDLLFEAVDEVAAVVEDDPAYSGYLSALTPLMSLQVPPAPPNPTP